MDGAVREKKMALVTHGMFLEEDGAPGPGRGRGGRQRDHQAREGRGSGRVGTQGTTKREDASA